MTTTKPADLERDLREYAVDTLTEWLRYAHVGQTPEDHEGIQVRLVWMTDGTTEVWTSGYPRELLARVRFQVTVHPLPVAR
jgi:hypothetical protein